MIVINKKLYEDDNTAVEEIILAALENDTKLVADLLKTGVDINTEFQGFTALHIAAMQDNSPMVDLLLQYREKIDFSIRTEHGQLAWQLAFDCGNIYLAHKIFDAEHPEVAANPEILAAMPRAASMKLTP